MDSLKNITAERLSTLLNKDLINLIIDTKMKNIPWLYYIDNIFYKYIINYNQLSEEGLDHLTIFIKTFPQFVFKLEDFPLCEEDLVVVYNSYGRKIIDEPLSDTLDRYLKTNNHTLSIRCTKADKILFKKDKIYYYLYTGENKDISINDEMITFFKNKNIHINRGFYLEGFSIDMIYK